MQIRIAAIGKIKEPYLRDGIAEFTKRLSPFCTLELREFPEVQLPAKKDINTVIEKEGGLLLSAVSDCGFVTALDPHGKNLSSTQLSKKIATFEIEGPYLIGFIIGGSYGLSDEIKQQVDLLLSFSSMTFTHQMTRLLLVEQIYRSFTIIRGIPYHR